MPTLKQITCTVDLSSSNVPLKEYQTVYGDGYVQTFIAVPSVSTPFSIHLQSKGYIAPGLSMFVYMDGEYQCNRNRHNLRIPDDGTTSRQTEVDFRVRQKEEIQANGTFLGSQWKFRELNILSNVAPIGGQLCPHNVEYIGTIEVLVLRCYHMQKATNSVPSRPTHNVAAPQSRKVKEPVPIPIGSSDTSSDEDASSAEDDTSPALGGLFDGANHDAPTRSGLLCFGGDASWDNTDNNNWDNGGQNWDNGGQNSWQQPADDNRWNDTPVANNNATVNQGQATIGQWDNQRSSAPGVRQSRARSNNGSKHSRQSSVTEVVPHVPDRNNAWGAQPNSQPTTSSPAVVVNVYQPGAAYMPSPVPANLGKPIASGSLRSPKTGMLPPSAGMPSVNRSSNNGSSESGSKSNNSIKQDGASATRDNNDWQANAGAAPGWDANPPATSKPSGAWGSSENNARGTTSWNNNGGDNNNWSAPNTQAQESQEDASGNGWNNGGDGNVWPAPNNQTQGSQQTASNSGWNNNSGQNNGGQNNANHSSQQQTSWDNGNASGNGNGNDGWNNNNSPQQTSGAEQAQQNAWDSGNGGADGNSNQQPEGNDSQPNNGRAWGANNGNNNAGQNFGNGPAISEGARKKWSLKSKYSNKAPSTVHGSVQPATAGMAPLNPYLATGPSMPIPLQPKPYWSIWKPEPESHANAPHRGSEATEGPIYSVPAEIAQRQMMSHQVLISKPTKYVHRTSRPKYIDSHDKPYAAFTFHYRSKDALEKMLGVSLARSEYDEKQRLDCLSKEQLIQEVLRAKTNTSSPDSSSTPTEVSSVKGSEKTVMQTSNHAAASGVGFGGLLANRTSRSGAKVISSPSPGTNPDLLWGRQPHQGLGISGGPHASTNDNVAGWLNNSGAASPGHFAGGHPGSPVTSPPMNGPGLNSGVANNSNSGNNQGTWGNGNDNQGQPQLANGAAWSNVGNGGQGQQRSMRGGSNNNGGGHTGQAWNNGGGNGNSQNVGGWNNDNRAPNGGHTWNNGGVTTNQNGGWNNDFQQGDNGPSTTQW